MATQGPTATTFDATTFSRVKDWAGSVQGINSALAAFGWVQTSDSNQIDWTNATVAPFSSASFPNTVLATSATAGGAVSPYRLNLRGNWVTSTTYNYLDVVRSTVGGGGTGNDYILSRTPSPVTSISVTANVATATAANNFSAGEIIRFTRFQASSYLGYVLGGQTFTVSATGLSSSSFQFTVPPFINSSGAQSDGTASGNTICLATIVVTSTTRPETDTKNYIPYYYEIWKTADTVTYSETAQSVSYVASSNVLTIATNTNNNRLKAGFNVTIAGATNLPQINGTWCVNSATATQVTFVIPTTVSGFSGNFSGTDTFTITYTMAPIYMKLEYWANGNLPWVRVALGTGADGNGNLTGNRIASDSPAGGQQTSGYGAEASQLANNSSLPAEDLRGTSTPTNPTSTIWRNIWSGANNRWGTEMFYNRNDTNAASPSGVGIFWIVERGVDDSSGGGTINYTDSYFTVLFGSVANAQLQAGNSVAQRSILKPNPSVTLTQVQVDGSNNATISFSTNQGFQFYIGSIVFFYGLYDANFLNGTLERVVNSSIPQTDTITNIALTANVVTVTCANTLIPGQRVVLSGIGTATFLNTQILTVLTASTSQFTANYTHANYTSAADTGSVTADGAVTVIIAGGHAGYGPTPSFGFMQQSTSLTTSTPIVGTGGVCWQDNFIITPRFGQSSTTVNGNTAMLPVFPVPGFIGNPMTMGMSVTNADSGTHDTTTSISLYGSSHTYYQGTGASPSDPFARFGNGNIDTMVMYMRWE